MEKLSISAIMLIGLTTEALAADQTISEDQGPRHGGKEQDRQDHYGLLAVWKWDEYRIWHRYCGILKPN